MRRASLVTCLTAGRRTGPRVFFQLIGLCARPGAARGNPPAGEYCLDNA